MKHRLAYNLAGRIGLNRHHGVVVRDPMRRGFTLVEMLVAVGLVVLMMTLFAQIFQMTTGTMATQKGISENDQRVRMVATLLRGDLKNRTMVEVGPFGQGEDTSLPTANTANRNGYFYIGENDPNDGSDDVLQFTTQVNATDDPYVGAARVLLPDGGGKYGPGSPSVTVPPGGNPPPLAPENTYWQNQPEFDDQLIGIPNYTSSSHMAEVSYFLRNGTLYRRMLLIREPSVSTAAQAGDDHSPTSWPSSTSQLNMGIYQPPTTPANARNFLTDFDFSAFNVGGGIQFHGAADIASGNVGSATAPHLSKPQYRFGHDPVTGIPREHVNQYLDATGTVQTGSRFIGRFTHEETSFINPGSGAYDLFGYPGMILGPGTAVPNPYRYNWTAADPNNTNLTYDPTTGKVREYTGGNRIAEDVLLANVKRFDVKVFDETAASSGAPGGWGPDGLPGIGGVDDDGVSGIDNPEEAGWEGSDDGAFADVGHAGNGLYSAANLLNNTYCPVDPTKPSSRLYRFDTWNPTLGADPPYRATRATPDPVTGFRRPLRAIQIKITFLDPTSNQVRDITIIQSLTSTAP